MKILAIETSCDETAAAVVEGKRENVKVLSDIVSSQIKIHREYGGVVPEVAARAHIETVGQIAKKALEEADITPNEIDRIAVTYGPGLVGSLIVGVETAKALSLAWDKPLFAVNHLEGHIYANFIGEKSIPFPILTLLISGGNTLLIISDSHFSHKVVGQTIDDAAGEAFDKVARLLGLNYPGGPEVSRLAKEGNPSAHQYPIVDLTKKPKRGADGFLVKQSLSCDFSFSGLKTAVLNTVKKSGRLDKDKIRDISASFEKTVANTIIQNVDRALKEYKPKTFILAGGVAANEKIRKSLAEFIKQDFPSILFSMPELTYCTDNAAMIGAAAYFKKDSEAVSNLKAEPTLILE